MSTGVLAAAAAAGVAAAAAAAGGRLPGSSSSSSSDDPQALVRTGMAKFRENDVEGSVADFDAALAASPKLRPYLWQRGLSLYYLSEHKEAAQQFRDDVAVNPNDTEESIWAFLSEAQLVGPEAARAAMLKVGRDPRPVMRAAYNCFRTQGASPDSILEAAAASGGPLEAGGHDAFYALLYVGLWHEAHGAPEAAQAAITRAAGTQYARLSGDYMASLARVHCQRRGWPL